MYKLDLLTLLKTKETYVHVFFWVFYFSAIHATFTDNWFDRSLRPESISQFSIVLFPILFYFNAFWLIPKYLKRRKWFQYIAITAGAIGLIECLRVLIYVSFSEIETTFSEAFITEFKSYDNIITGRLNPIVICLQFSFAYRFTRDWIVNNTLIDKLKAEKIKMELAFLKAQVNPHFLFNNLNTVDELIDRSPSEAKRYLHKLSTMYRYVLTYAEKDVVSLEDEWNFIDDYLYLLRERYGTVYNFSKHSDISNLEMFLIPPTSIQCLIENAVKHNHGSVEQPLNISIAVTSTHVVVSHKKQLKYAINNSLGTGLKNLKSRYQLLSNQEIDINDGAGFKVSLPLIKSLTAI